MNDGVDDQRARAAILLGLDSGAVPEPALVDALRVFMARDEDPPDELDLSPSGEQAAMALLALVPDALARHRRLGIPEEITTASLRDVGRKHAHYGAETVLPWLLGILRGDVLEVGRLQVERRAGRYGHALHIPENGPLSPAAVDRSLARASALTGGTVFSCTSWLLDARITAALPDSNIAAFSARFRIVDPGDPTPAASTDVAKFVFRRSAADVRDPSRVTPRSSLEALVAATLRGGADWTEPLGVLHAAPGSMPAS